VFPEEADVEANQKGGSADKIVSACSQPSLMVYPRFMKHMIDPEGKRLPIKLDETSNGEFEPVSLDLLLLYLNESCLTCVSAACYLGSSDPQHFLLGRKARLD
jgi:hypothetical protein